jgi:transcription initiation factor TFIID subunit TAF12
MDTFQKTLDDTTGGVITAQKERERRLREQRRQQQQQRQRQQQQPGGVQVEQARTSSTDSPLEQSLAPVLKAEKSDLMFWMMVLQVLLLVGIWRNTQSGG